MYEDVYELEFARGPTINPYSSSTVKHGTIDLIASTLDRMLANIPSRNHTQNSFG